MSFEPIILVVLIVVAAIVLVNKPSNRRRLFSGVALAVIGWGGLFLGLMLGDHPLMQSETVATLWMGIFGAIGLIASPAILISGISFRKPKGRA